MNQNINDLFADSEEKSEDANKLKNKLSQIKQDNKEEETETQARALNLGYINLKGFPINPGALALISLTVAKKIQGVCFYLTDKEIKIGIVDPNQSKFRKFIDKLSQEKGIQPNLFLISELSLKHALKLYDNLPKVIEVKEGVDITEKDLKKYQQKNLSFDKIKDLLNISDVSEIIVAIIAVAIQIEASDIHIEAEEKDIKIRLRVDGILHVVSALDNELWRRIIARIKLIAGLKINVSDQPQDGRFTIHLSQEDIDVRVSTIPTKYGESVVMRLLKSSATSLEFDSLGIRGSAFEGLEEQIKRPNGMIITTGPTGSGKTTTLYAILKKLNSSLSDVQIEDMVHKYNAVFDFIKNPQSGIRVVNGPEIVYWYNSSNYAPGGTLARSCMRHKKNENQIKFYAENPDKIALCIYVNEENKLEARSLVWKLDEPANKIYMDRIYHTNMKYNNILKNYGKEKGWLIRGINRGNKVVHCKDTKNNYPWFDSFVISKKYGDKIKLTSNEN